MPLFSRSADRSAKTKSPHRFSFRKHHHVHQQRESTASSSSSSSLDARASQLKGDSGRSAPPSRPTRAPERTIVVSHPPPVTKPSDSVSSSVRSSASTLRSTSPTLAENLSSEEDTETRDSVDTTLPQPQPQRSSQRLSQRGSVRLSRSSTSTAGSMRSSRNSLAEYRQLQCSMTYKNRVAGDIFRSTSTTASSTASDASRMSDLRASLVEGFRPSSAVRAASDGHVHPPMPTPTSSSASASDSETTSPTTRVSEPTPMLAPRPTDPQMNEASVAALQTRRAFQQMVLAMEDEDSGDEYDSDSDDHHMSSAASSSGVVRLGADEYRKFQFRLRQLEELSQQQARRQADMEATIEQEVQTRTRKVVEAMERQISMYKQAKELEFEREMQRRLSEHLEGGGSTRSARVSGVSRQSNMSMRRSSGLYGSTLHTSNSVGSFRDSYGLSPSIDEKGSKPLEKLLHPRRSRKRLEQMREREEQQKREMEQFREFIRTTEMRSTLASTATPATTDVLNAAQLAAATEKLKELADPLLPETLLQAPPSELVELLCVLRRHSREQEQQLEQAKTLVTAAIEARENAEATAREAVELTLMLDARLDRVAREEHNLAVRVTRQPSAAEEFCQARETRGVSTASMASASELQLGTPASQSVLD